MNYMFLGGHAHSRVINVDHNGPVRVPFVEDAFGLSEPTFPLLCESEEYFPYSLVQGGARVTVYMSRTKSSYGLDGHDRWLIECAVRDGIGVEAVDGWGHSPSYGSSAGREGYGTVSGARTTNETIKPVSEVKKKIRAIDLSDDEP